METRQEILARLLRLEKETGFELITVQELKEIDKLWDVEGDLSKRALVELFYSIKGYRLPWDEYKHAKYSQEEVDLIKSLAERHDVPFDLVSKLMVTVDNTKFYTRSSITTKEVERLINQEWLHYEYVREEMKDGHQADPHT